MQTPIINIENQDDIRPNIVHPDWKQFEQDAEEARKHPESVILLEDALQQIRVKKRRDITSPQP